MRWDVAVGTNLLRKEKKCGLNEHQHTHKKSSSKIDKNTFIVNWKRIISCLLVYKLPLHVSRQAEWHRKHNPRSRRLKIARKRTRRLQQD